MDSDHAAVCRGLNRALEASGLSQSAFAAALGTSPSRLSTYRSGRTVPSAAFYLRAQRIGAALGETLDNGWTTPPVVADAITKALAEPDEIWAFKLVLQARDHVHEALHTRPKLAGAWEAIPPSTDRPEWDVFLAAVMEHEFRSLSMEPPDWMQQAVLTEDWILDSPLLDEEGVRRSTPSWLALRRVYVSSRDLTTV
ncbi:helix-turn-helix transcriptional regulator [Kineosporia sp. NBRC 101731]|uniref:helix-turn-helix domain-containing protein n=1 Tax=Kineosporia sp. NBRC 101731 TaxID=3032199 RepID=UPI0024A27417|nr:helix-turn-helix transcriptional regulator [Kineosporia sp. NBRC 101731]GLY29077.1 hypothetical protein Kisp02_24420 [Kineosporia sp. NBRC 101731]